MVTLSTTPVASAGTGPSPATGQHCTAPVAAFATSRTRTGSTVTTPLPGTSGAPSPRSATKDATCDMTEFQLTVISFVAHDWMWST